MIELAVMIIFERKNEMAQSSMKVKVQKFGNK